MGKLMQPQIHHFSHPHILQLSNLNQNQQHQSSSPIPSCSGCRLQASGYMYTCYHCNFSLHESCTKFAQLITHPSHSPAHHLSLLPISPYPGGIFNCDACNRRGDGFSYHCAKCDFDLHVLCASKPLTIVPHQQWHVHKLQLTFRPPYQAKGFSCDVCRKIGCNEWIYRCHECEFDIHLDCAAVAMASAPPQPPAQLQIQHLHSFPGAAVATAVAPPPHPAQTQLQPPPPLQYNHSFPGASAHHYRFQTPVEAQPIPQAQLQPPLQHHLTFPGTAAPGINAQPNYCYMHSASTGALETHPAGVGVGTSGSGNSVMDAVAQGFVEGAAQQVGQNFVQNLAGGGGGSGGDAVDGSGDSSSASFMDVGSSFLSSMFGE